MIASCFGTFFGRHSNDTSHVTSMDVGPLDRKNAKAVALLEIAEHEWDGRMSYLDDMWKHDPDRVTMIEEAERRVYNARIRRIIDNNHIDNVCFHLGVARSEVSKRVSCILMILRRMGLPREIRLIIVRYDEQTLLKGII